MANIHEKLLSIQCELKAPKNQYSDFGGYFYRNCEDILESLKPLLKNNNSTVVLTDELIYIGDRYYIQATATFYDCENGDSIEVKALAREEESKKKLDSSQVTGATSSYARKYALNGLFGIDDSKDSDNDSIKGEPTKEQLLEEFKNEIKRTKKSATFFMKKAKVEKVEDMTGVFLKECINALKQYETWVEKEQQTKE